MPAPSNAKERLQEHYCLFDTDLGVCGVAWSGRGLTRLQLPEADRRATEGRLRRHAGRAAADAPPPIRRAIADIQSYLAGRKVEFQAIALDLAGVSPFRRSIYEAARAVDWGRTVSYGELAERAGVPGAARAVGQALGQNPVPLIIPCHRILAAGKAAGGFSAFGGTDTKMRLLALEGVRLGEAAPLLPGLLPR